MEESQNVFFSERGEAQIESEEYDGELANMI